MNDLEAQANEEHENLMSHLWEHRYSAKIKLWLVHALMNDRKENERFFSNADYIPLTVEGPFASNVLAYARRLENEWYIIAVPLHLAAICQQQQQEILSVEWKDTRIVLPSDAPSNYQSLFSKIDGTHQKEIAVEEIFKSLPLAVLKSKNHD
jgi:maltooligosyltrehalose synthase